MKFEVVVSRQLGRAGVAVGSGKTEGPAGRVDLGEAVDQARDFVAGGGVGGRLPRCKAAQSRHLLVAPTALMAVEQFEQRLRRHLGSMLERRSVAVVGAAHGAAASRAVRRAGR